MVLRASISPRRKCRTSSYWTVMMPGMEGIEVARELQRDTETGSIPVIMLTSRDADADFEQSRQVGVFAYLVKPFSPLQLVNTVESALEAGGSVYSQRDELSSGE